jgi:hypothetical protein
MWLAARSLCFLLASLPARLAAQVNAVILPAAGPGHPALVSGSPGVGGVTMHAGGTLLLA